MGTGDILLGVNPAMDQHPIQGGVAILSGMLHHKETGISFDRCGLRLLCTFNFFLPHHSVLVGADDMLKISDFGTSKEFSDKSAKMTFAGTVAWMAPEVIRNEPCSEKVDVW